MQECLRGKDLGPKMGGFTWPASQADKGATDALEAGSMVRGGAYGASANARQAGKRAQEAEFATKATKFHSGTIVLFTRLLSLVLQLPATPKLNGMGRVKCL